MYLLTLSPTTTRPNPDTTTSHHHKSTALTLLYDLSTKHAMNMYADDTNVPLDSGGCSKLSKLVEEYSPASDNIIAAWSSSAPALGHLE